MYCKNCGTQIPDNAAFCPNCRAQQTPAGAYGNAPPPKAKKPIFKKWWFWVAIAIVVIAIVVPKGDSGDGVGVDSAPPQADVSPSVEPANDARITADEFAAIDTGMTYEEVVEIIGGEGELLSEADIGMGDEYITQIYMWEGSGGIGANANITFQGGKVMAKAQIGLK